MGTQRTVLMWYAQGRMKSEYGRNCFVLETKKYSRGFSGSVSVPQVLSGRKSRYGNIGVPVSATGRALSMPLAATALAVSDLRNRENWKKKFSRLNEASRCTEKMFVMSDKIGHCKRQTQCMSVSQSGPHMEISAMGKSWIYDFFVKFFQGVSTQEACLRAVFVLGFTFIAVLTGNKLISWVFEKELSESDTLLEKGIEEKPFSIRRISFLAISSMRKPLQVLLPWMAIMFDLRVCAAFGEVTLIELGKFTGIASQKNTMLFNIGVHAVRFLSRASVWAFDILEVLIIIIASWWFILFKNSLLEKASEVLLEKASSADARYNVMWVMNLAGTLLTWLTIFITIATSFIAFGYDVRPFLTFGSASTIFIGFVAQSTVANIVSGLSLYASQVCRVGDRIELKAKGGNKILEGTVQQISPFQTIIRTDSGLPTFVQNKDMLNSVLIVNSSLRHTELGLKTVENPSFVPMVS